MSTSTAPRGIAAGPDPDPAHDPGRRARRRDRWRLGAVSLVWAVSLLVAALWVRGGGLQAIAAAFSGAPADALDSLGRLTGLVAAELLLLQVLLLAGVPLFERGFGRDGMIRAHRIVGMWSFGLLSAHIVLLVIGYGIASGESPLLQLWDFTWNYAGMLLAVAGTLLIVLVGLTSARRARRRLRYESWHLLHLYAYLGVGLAIPHMIWTGGDFVGDALTSTVWWTLWGATAAAVLWFRALRPLARSLRHRVAVDRVEADGLRGVRVVMRGRRLDRLGAAAGQFLVWRFLDGPGWTRGHPFSLAEAPTADRLVISAQLVGDGTARLTRLAPGVPVLFEGPFGAMTGEQRRGQHLLMLGAGFGVAPLVALLQSERYAPGEATLVTRDHEPGAASSRAAIAELVRRRGVRHIEMNGARTRVGSTWLPATHAAWNGPELLRYIAEDLDRTDVYLCGPDAWADAVADDLRAAGVRRERLHRESFSTGGA